MTDQITQLVLGTVHDDSKDVEVLTYMSQIALDVLGQSQRPASFSRPHVTHVESVMTDLRHHVITYAYCTLQKGQLPFVGFLSRRNLSPTSLVNTSVADADRAMVESLIKLPGLLNYSSLGLSDGNWCNLVIFEQGTCSEDLVVAELSQHASYDLAPLYYQWIRIHYGLITRDSIVRRMTIQKTRYYTFDQPQTPTAPTIIVQTRQEPVTLQSDALVL